MIVADATLVAGFLFPRDDLHALAKAVRKVDSEWRCPELVFSEVRSVALKHHRKGAPIESVIEQCNLLASAVSVHRMHSRSVLAAATEGDIWSYDAEYVALARQLGTRLVTTDDAVLNAFPALAITPARFLAR
jgi:predicted nucleic acid-binding protein